MESVSSWNRWSFLRLLLVSIVVLVGRTEAQENLGIYLEVPAYPCTTLADLNGRIGCTSSRNGDVGSLWPIESEEDLTAFIDSPPSGKIVAVLPYRVFSRTFVEKLIDTRRVTGILVAPGDKPAQGFSPVSKFPLKQYGLHRDSNHEWNPIGDEFAFQFYEIPMFALDPQSVNPIVNKAHENKKKNGGYPRHGVRLHDWMHSSQDAETCLKRGQCQPLGGKSTLSSFEPWEVEKEKIFVSAWLDSNSFFHDLAVGADADISGVVSILLAATALSKVDRSQFEKQIVFALFQAESWGYVGSKRLIYDIENFVCEKQEDNYCSTPFKESLEFKKLKLNKISAFIELQHVGNLSGDTLYFHQEENQNNNKITQQLMQQASASNLSVKSVDNTPGIPPSSLMAFLLARPSIPGIVLAEFSQQYTNKFFHSEMDDTIQARNICSAATLVARTVYALANPTHSVPDNLTADCDLAIVMVDCLTKNLACPWAQAFLSSIGSYSPQPTQYTSVYRDRSIFSIVSKLVHDYLVELTGTREASCNSNSDCNSADCIKGVCIKSATVFHDALSTAFNEDWTIVNKQESTWTESNWDGPYVELFLIESPTTESIVLLFGVLELIASFLIVFFGKKYLEKRFKAA